MTSIERTAYPRSKRLITAHELLLFFAPSRDEVEWAAARADCDEHLLAQLLAPKSYQRMGCFPKLDEIPDRSSTSFAARSTCRKARCRGR
ncbi:hypothetical protein [Streptomyces sp. NPDC020362]|uniref:hypothetical protein n=1 Tax=unclassified Streptomyces TaxID=2593676 RepID=UPI000AC41E72